MSAVKGISRVGDNDRVLLLSFDARPTDDDMRDIHDLLREGVEAAVDRIELQQAFNLRWLADMRAIKRWQAAHPGREHVWPDHADMVVWLLEQLDAKAAQ